jgi:hypothetical protein
MDCKYDTVDIHSYVAIPNCSAVQGQLCVLKFSKKILTLQLKYLAKF